MRFPKGNRPMDHFGKIPHLLAGILDCWNTSPGFRLHWVADGLAFILGWRFKISTGEWNALIILAALKAGLELQNSATEKLADKQWPREEGDNPTAKRVKDFAGAGVFVSVLASLAIWTVTFLPRLLGLVKRGN